MDCNHFTFDSILSCFSMSLFFFFSSAESSDMQHPMPFQQLMGLVLQSSLEVLRSYSGERRQVMLLFVRDAILLIKLVSKVCDWRPYIPVCTTSLRVRCELICAHPRFWPGLHHAASPEQQVQIRRTKFKAQDTLTVFSGQIPFLHTLSDPFVAVELKRYLHQVGHQKNS